MVLQPQRQDGEEGPGVAPLQTTVGWTGPQAPLLEFLVWTRTWGWYSPFLPSLQGSYPMIAAFKRDSCWGNSFST